MVGRDRETGDAVGMTLEVCDKGGFDPSSTAAVSRNKALPRRATTADSAIVDFGAKVALQLAVVVQVEVFEKIADARLVSIYPLINRVHTWK